MVEGTHTLNSLSIDEDLLSRMEATTVTPVSDIHVSEVADVASIFNLDSGEYHTLTHWCLKSANDFLFPHAQLKNSRSYKTRKVSPGLYL